MGENIKLCGMLSSADISEPKLVLVTSRILQLKKWFSSFFFSTFTPTIGINVMNNYTLVAEPFSMILRYTKQQQIIQNV